MSDRHYLDHASTSPARPEVVEAMLEWMSVAHTGDPARVHTEGRMARSAIEEARSAVAGMLRVRSRQCIFTSTGTEAVNAAVWSAVRSRPQGAIVCPAVEHSCVREASRRLAPVVEVGVDRLGRIDLDAYHSALASAAGAHGSVALAHCQWGNHEVATLQPVGEVVAMCQRLGIPTHVDAAAACGRVETDLGTLGADFVSVSAHKFGGPEGVGALIVAPGLRIDPLVVGGDQERGRRAGMENTPAIVGFGVAAALVGTTGLLEMEKRRAWAQTARIYDVAGELEGVVTYGDGKRRLPHIACLGVDGVEAEAVLLGLDQAGIAAHSGSSCSSEFLAPSAVLEAIGADAERSLRVSVGWSTTTADIDAFVEALPRVLDRLRALRSE